MLIGGSGTVGSILATGLKQVGYSVFNMDKKPPSSEQCCPFIEVDATNYQQLLERIPAETDTIINLLKVDAASGVESITRFQQLSDIFFHASYYILMAARENRVRRVVFASSNHVTDGYEKDGYSLLNREIHTEDLPKTNSLYGILKFASEQAGRLFAQEGTLSVINIRIASVPAKSQQAVKDRLNRTMLTDDDLIELMKCAIETTQDYGTYYGVSNHLHKPWSTWNAHIELGFTSKQRNLD